MRISDWSSDVCSSDLDPGGAHRRALAHQIGITGKLKTQQGIAGSDLLPQRLRAQRGQIERVEKSEHGRYAIIRAHRLGHGVDAGTRSDERRVGQEGVRTGRSRGSPYT